LNLSFQILRLLPDCLYLAEFLKLQGKGGEVKSSRGKARKSLRSEAYRDVRRNDEGRSATLHMDFSQCRHTLINIASPWAWPEQMPHTPMPPPRRRSS
jgi:hypothetical protein